MKRSNPKWSSVCSVTGCDGRYEARGFCDKHYQQAMDRGDIRPLTTEDRFWMKVDRRGPDECWPWLGNKHGTGYGQFRIAGMVWKAHRVALHFATGMVAIKTVDGLTDLVLHKCDNRVCCNPAHLEVGTHLKNNQDRELRGRAVYLRGERQGGAKLTQAKVQEIRANEHVSLTALAKKFGVTKGTIWKVRHGMAWQHTLGVAA